jgi:hypothetical protein
MCLPTSHLMTETDPVSETLCSLEYRTMDKVQKLVIPNVIHHPQTPTGPTYIICILRHILLELNRACFMN